MSVKTSRLLRSSFAVLAALSFGVIGAGTAAAVEFVKLEEVANCELVQRQQCATKRNNAFVRCAEWHERRARQHGATHVVLGQFVEHSSFLFIGSGDQLEAVYYDCRGSSVGSSGNSRRASADSVVTGSGFFITEQCHFVTNHHVVDGAEHILLTTHAGDVVSMQTVSSDPSNDIAILVGECESTPLPLKASSGALKGQEVFTIGYPLVQLQGTEQKASFGRINADSGIKGDVRFLQVDVPIQPGNSGGPLIDEYGNVVGVVTARLNELLTLQATGSLPQNVNYALKIDYLYPLLKYAKIEPTRPASDSQVSTIRSIAESEKSVGMIKAVSTR